MLVKKRTFSVIQKISKNVPGSLRVFEFQTVIVTAFVNKQPYSNFSKNFAWINFFREENEALLQAHLLEFA